MIRKPAIALTLLVPLLLGGCFGSTCQEEYGLTPGTPAYGACVNYQRQATAAALQHLSNTAAYYSRPAY